MLNLGEVSDFREIEGRWMIFKIFKRVISVKFRGGQCFYTNRREVNDILIFKWSYKSVKFMGGQ